MTDPITALIYSSFIVIILVLLFWTKKGIFWQFRLGKQNTDRVIMEDALKQLFDHEYLKRPGTLESLSGALQLKRETTAKIMEKLTSMGLVEFIESQLKLTTEGKRYALRIIRTHRLWERYFADETGLAEEDWHREAEQREHTTSAEQAEELASHMGYPSFDPHGDPIPTERGELPPKKGQPLSGLNDGDYARIEHIEDEPEALYAQLVTEGLYPGMQLNIIEKTKTKIRFFADGEEIVLAIIAANNISAVLLEKEQIEKIDSESLSDLKIGELGEVTVISKACRGLQRRRLMDLGIVPGTVVSAEFSSAGANPVAYGVRGSLIALRDDQAAYIKIKRTELQ